MTRNGRHKEKVFGRIGRGRRRNLRNLNGILGSRTAATRRDRRPAGQRAEDDRISGEI